MKQYVHWIEAYFGEDGTKAKYWKGDSLQQGSRKASDIHVHSALTCDT